MGTQTDDQEELDFSAFGLEAAFVSASAMAGFDPLDEDVLAPGSRVLLAGLGIGRGPNDLFPGGIED